MSDEKEEWFSGEEWLQLIPVGFRFCPTDEEILQYYLLRHVTGNYILPGIIHQVDLYECNPYHLPGINKEWEYTYCFTRRERKYANGTNIDRVTRDGRGHWKVTITKPIVLAQDGTNLGKKNTLNYLVKNSTGEDEKDVKTEWIMHEFVISYKLAFPSIASNDEYYNDIVACRIYKKKSEPKELKNLINSLIGPNPFTTDHNNGESLNQIFEPNMQTLITYDQSHYTAINSNYEIGESSNTTFAPPQDNIVATGGGVSGGLSDQDLTTVYQNHSDEAKIEFDQFSGTNLCDDIAVSRSPSDEAFEKYLQLLEN